MPMAQMKKSGDIHAALKEVISSEPGQERYAVIEWADVLGVKPAELAMELLELAAGKLRVRQMADGRRETGKEKSEAAGGADFTEAMSIKHRRRIREHFHIPPPGEIK